MTTTYIPFPWLILADTAAVFLPLLRIFYRDWRLSLGKTAGILFGYLLFILAFSSIFSPSITGHIGFLLWSLFTMYTSLTLAFFLIKIRIPILIYMLFLIRCFSDGGTCICQLAAARMDLPPVLCALLLPLLPLSTCIFAIPHIRNAMYYTIPLPQWRKLAPIPVLLFLLSSLRFLLRDPLTFESNASVYVCSAIIWMGLIYMFHAAALLNLSVAAQRRAIAARYKTAQLLTQVQSSQIKEMQDSMEQMRMIRHDLRYHIIAVQAMLEQNQPENALNYIRSYSIPTILCRTVDYCPNLCANCILNYYLERAKEHSIQVSARISLPQLLPLPDTDFCTILGNLLSNALEACERQKEGTPSITVNISQTGESILTLSIRNTYDHVIRVRRDRFLASDREEEGIGTASVRYLASLYHGVVTYRHENGIFEASVLLNPQTDQNSPEHP